MKETIIKVLKGKLGKQSHGNPKLTFWGSLVLQTSDFCQSNFILGGKE